MAKKIKAVLLLGAPGCGKGTQGKVLGTLLGFIHVASGDLFRALDKNSELGKIFLEYSNKGLLVPDDFTVRLWKDHVDRMVAAGKFNPQSDTLVLDGIPRNVAQARVLDPHIEVMKLVVMSVDRDREEVVRRLKVRATQLGRLDDAKEEVVRRRLEVYDKETAPLLSYYPLKLRVTVDALQAPLEVAHDIFAGLLGRTQELRLVKT